jgi:hypothetical protein
MRNGTQLAGLVLGALGVAVTLRAIYHWGSMPMTALGLCAAIAGTVLIFRGHYRGR